MKIKYLFFTILVITFVIPAETFLMAQTLNKDLKIHLRTEWDDNEMLLSQYHKNKKLGEKIRFPVLGKMRTRKIKEICYLTPNGDSCILEEIQSRIIIHHTALSDQNLTPKAQVKFFRDGEILDKNYWFSDIAYHFIITSDGSMFEGRPITHMGVHAGKIAEPEIFYDPDYGSIGIVLVGNFDKSTLNDQQLNSLILLINWLKTKYHIPNKGIFYHHEVKKLVEDSGLTSLAKDKTCPGHNFPEKNWLIKQLVPDTKESKQKEILLCK